MPAPPRSHILRSMPGATGQYAGRPVAFRAACAIAASALPLLACDRAPGSSADVAVLPRITLTQDLRIGSVDDPDAGFSRIGPVAVDGDGDIHVFELAESRIRVYDRDGNFLRGIGRQGKGPGEFGSIYRFGVTGDTIWTIDLGLRRITLFDRTGSVLSTGNIKGVNVDLQSGTAMGVVMPRGMRADGLFNSDMPVLASRRDMPASSVGEGDTVQVPRVVFDASGNPIDTIGFVPFPPPRPSRPRFVEVGTTRYSVPPPPDDRPLVVAMTEGSFIIERRVARSSEPAAIGVVRLTESGDTVYAREFAYSPVRYTEIVLDTIAMRSARIPGGSFNPAMGPEPTPEGVDINAVRNLIRSSMSYPDYQIPVSFGAAGDDGSLWLRREDDGGPTMAWMVLDPDGENRGIVELPRYAFPRWISRDSFITVELDEMDVQWLVRYRLARGKT